MPDAEPFMLRGAIGDNATLENDMANRSMAAKVERAARQRVEAARQAAYSSEYDMVHLGKTKQDHSALIEAYDGPVTREPCKGIMPRLSYGNAMRGRTKGDGGTCTLPTKRKVKGPMQPAIKWARQPKVWPIVTR